MLKSGSDPRYKYLQTDKWKVWGESKGIPKGCSVSYYDVRVLGEVIASNEYNARQEAKSRWGRHCRNFIVERIVARMEK